MEAALQRLIQKLELNENLISTLLGGVVLLMVVVLVFNYLQIKPTPDSTKENTIEKIGTIGQTSSTATQRYTVKSNDSLWSIARDHYQDGYKWTEIAKANNLLDPNLIESGMELDLPVLKTEINSEQTIEVLDTKTPQPPKSYTVKVNDFLWKIAVEVYGDGYQWPKIYEANLNQISNPNILTSGTVLTIP